MSHGPQFMGEVRCADLRYFFRIGDGAQGIYCEEKNVELNSLQYPLHHVLAVRETKYHHKHNIRVFVCCLGAGGFLEYQGAFIRIILQGIY